MPRITGSSRARPVDTANETLWPDPPDTVPPKGPITPGRKQQGAGGKGERQADMKERERKNYYQEFIIGFTGASGGYEKTILVKIEVDPYRQLLQYNIALQKLGLEVLERNSRLILSDTWSLGKVDYFAWVSSHGVGENEGGSSNQIMMFLNGADLATPFGKHGKDETLDIQATAVGLASPGNVARIDLLANAAEMMYEAE